MCAATRRAAIHVKVTPVRRNLSVGTFAKKSILRMNIFWVLFLILANLIIHSPSLSQSQPSPASHLEGASCLMATASSHAISPFPAPTGPGVSRGKSPCLLVSATNFIAWSEYYQNWPEAVTKKKNYFVFLVTYKRAHLYSKSNPKWRPIFYVFDFENFKSGNFTFP